MPHCTPSSGHSLSEYAIMFALLLLICIGSVSFLGTSTSNLLGKAANGDINGMTAYMDAMLGDGKVSVTGKSQVGAGNEALVSEDGRVTLFSDNLSVGVNSTGAEGNDVKVGLAHVRYATQQAKRLEELADAATNEDVKKKLKLIAFDAYWIAGSQAAYEFHTYNNTNLLEFSQSILNTDKPDPELGRRGLYSAQANLKYLNEKLKSFSAMPAATAEQKAYVQSIVSKINAQQARYQTALRQSQQLNPIPPERGLKFNDIGDGSEAALAKSVSAQSVKAAGLDALSSGKTDKTPAIKTEVTSGQSTESYADKI